MRLYSQQYILQLQVTNQTCDLFLFCSQSVVADISAEDVKGIGFDATCSLVAVDEAGSPVTVSPTGTKKELADVSYFNFVSNSYNSNNITVIEKIDVVELTVQDRRNKMSYCGWITERTRKLTLSTL